MRESDKWRWKATPEEAVEAMKEEHGELKVDVKKVKIVAGAVIYGIKIHEFRAEILINGETKTVNDTTPIGWFNTWGILKRWDSFKKSETFLNSEVGKKWLGYFLQECKIII
jgi:hypothetical protein